MTRRDFLPELHWFRAFAIVNIMLAHVWFVPPKHHGLPGARIVEDGREILFHDSTIYFLFISGFLARWLSDRTRALAWYRKKALYILLPYVLFSLAYLVEWGVRTGPGLAGFAERIPGALLRGDAERHYWYIPFIVPIFLATPLLLRLPSKAISRLALVAALLPLLGTRTGTQVTVGQYVYLAPAYLLGMYAALDYPRTLDRLRRWRWVSLAAAVAATVALAWFGTEKREVGFVNLTESVFWVQKLGFCAFFLALFAGWKGKELPLLNRVAECSFGLYFVHFAVAHNRFARGLYDGLLDRFPGGVVPISVAYTLAVCVVSLGVVLLAKRVLGRRSRYLIGS